MFTSKLVLYRHGTVLRTFTSITRRNHENPLGLPFRPPSAPQMPRRGGPIQKRRIEHVKKVIVVASGKGGVGKSTIAVNLAFSLAMLSHRPRVGILDLDIFGPSIPTLMGLQHSDDPQLTSAGALVPIINHGIPTMSMGYLVPRPPPDSTEFEGAIVWRGLMVQKAVQQLLFDVDWRDTGGYGPGLDVLIIDMPPGTGDVPLTLGQLVIVDGAVIVSTPQDVALTDVRRGISMFKKISVPITGFILNQASFLCPSCNTTHELFGPPTNASRLGIPLLAQLPLVGGVSWGGDHGIPFVLEGTHGGAKDGRAGEMWRDAMNEAASKIWGLVQS
ncbi:P-loop containing nucleoside triphosphate hydrolase protein [Suillus clintonianus]|uniref:P-loop containing nucleoside triphosphate hydrolase protein n=1 Tax=Suillus clintonianus TaxID=1904413 RepID=UPI001B85EA29|nr:P-loop containing nucleoside triphosphate hydrolase protein [Suillus clintonianus]KAG2124373.1 P-loop containing nucleoside triphosphate hydrolase protein [Suillus clintonianus]